MYVHHWQALQLAEDSILSHRLKLNSLSETYQIVLAFLSVFIQYLLSFILWYSNF